jgi:hypothetical protein
LIDADTHGSGQTRGGKAALAQLAAAGADAVLSGHVHDPFDMTINAGGARSASSARARFRSGCAPRRLATTGWTGLPDGLQVRVVTAS